MRLKDWIVVVGFPREFVIQQEYLRSDLLVWKEFTRMLHGFLVRH
jgi:hypothetical protein